jgi:hypothetical protein
MVITHAPHLPRVLRLQPELAMLRVQRGPRGGPCAGQPVVAPLGAVVVGDLPGVITDIVTSRSSVQVARFVGPLGRDAKEGIYLARPPSIPSLSGGNLLESLDCTCPEVYQSSSSSFQLRKRNCSRVLGRTEKNGKAKGFPAWISVILQS